MTGGAAGGGGLPGVDSAQPGGSFVVSIVGIDGCGKTSTFEGVLAALARDMTVAGIGDRVLGGGAGQPLFERAGIPRARLTHAVGQLAKGLRSPALYKNVKFLDLTERTRLLEYVARYDAPRVIVSDGDPLVNTAAWAAARFARERLAGDDDALAEGLALLTRERKLGVRALPRELRRSWQLAVLNWLPLGRFVYPDLVVFLRLDPSLALSRIRARGAPLQAHETEAFLAGLDRAYERVCALLAVRRGLPVVRLRVDELTRDETVARVSEAIRVALQTRADAETEAGDAAVGDGIDVIATTMSGSLEDQAKVSRIGPEFRTRTRRPVRVHVARTHVEARELARVVAARGGRLVVSAGGAGTFNAVVEGVHIGGRVPGDLRLAFLRKGSADLIGKVLGIPDTLPEAVQAIVGGIESGNTVAADVLAVGVTAPDGTPVRRRLVGFGGFGVFGDVPRFTESRLIKLYKGVLGQLFGDLGPFMTGFALATAYWNVERLRRRRPALSLVLDGEELAPERWVSVVVMNGDLGRDFKLGRGIDLAGGSFRVIALRYLGMRTTIRQAVACKTAAVLDDPERYGALVRTVTSLTVRPRDAATVQMVNVDGLKQLARGDVSVSVEGRIALVPGRPGPA